MAQGRMKGAPNETCEGLQVYLAKHYTIRGALIIYNVFA